MTKPIENRYDFVFFFDVKNGNPNGDPDAGNLPRIDPETSKGIVSDVCLKRKVRNYVDLVRGQEIDGPDAEDGSLGYKIYVQQDAVLDDRNAMAYKSCNITPQSKKKIPKDDLVRLTRFMTDNFFDIRTFGAVMSASDSLKCGQVRGPVQMCFAESVDPVVPLEMSITRMAVTKEDENKDNKTMGRKQYIPYGLYREEGFVSASLAERTGFSEDDLHLFCEALMNMFENDRSASRGLMTSRELVLFRHDSKLGNAPAHRLFDLVKAERTIPEGREARRFEDYRITLDQGAVPAGVTAQVFDYIPPSA